MSTSRPVPLGRMTGRRPAAASRSATRRVVRCSANPVSGFACRSRRNSISSASCWARKLSRSATRSLPSMFTPVMALPVKELVFGELPYQRPYDVVEVPRPPVDGLLPLVGGTVLKHLVGDGKLVGTAKPIRHRLKRAQQLVQLVAHRRGGSVVVGDDHRVEAVAGRAPLVVADQPRGRGRQRVAAVELVVEELDQGLRERGGHAYLAERRRAVKHAYLDGAEVRVRPDVPPDLLDGPDRPRAQQDVHVLLELRPVRQAWRRPGRRQRAEGHGPARGETRVIAAPERARRGKREEV